MSDNYEIGYRNPPKHTQFQKGKSGNPKGRSKKEKTTFFAIADHVANKRVYIQENGRRKQVGLMEAYLNRLFADAIKGDRYAQKIIQDIYIKRMKLKNDVKDYFMKGLMDEMLKK